MVISVIDQETSGTDFGMPLARALLAVLSAETYEARYTVFARAVRQAGGDMLIPAEDRSGSRTHICELGLMGIVGRGMTVAEALDNWICAARRAVREGETLAKAERLITGSLEGIETCHIAAAADIVAGFSSSGSAIEHAIRTRRALDRGWL